MNLVAVTSCPTGIAHSQMAAENLEQTADRLGHDIKVEVQGAMGTENELTADEIDDADAVIIAADTSVKRDRFQGKPLMKGTVKDAVNDAEHLIQEASAAESDGQTDGEATDGDTRSSRQNASTRSRGGDRSKGLFARLKRLFS
ncbi:PTS fructose transporter subunit IIB [Halobacterium zhouii]|uniref:PTS fructose transporter subunit IIB n=1 Tax=Halobacterium zhouii TaxID=2902624 RepID=UPI001E61353D|nr:PTS fructose transporter subunit IIB [Halobacterium zhouii]